MEKVEGSEFSPMGFSLSYAYDRLIYRTNPKYYQSKIDVYCKKKNDEYKLARANNPIRPSHTGIPQLTYWE